MHRYFIATVISLTVIITGFAAAPARADSDDLAKALAGIAALAIIGKAISDSNKNDHVSHNYTYQHHRPHQQIHRPHVIKPKPLPHRVSRKALPQRCIRHVQMRNGNTRRVFGSRCLNRHYQQAHRLPNQCVRQINTQRGYRTVYGARCLRNNGFQVARY